MPNERSLADLTDAALEARIAAARKVHAVIVAIFAIIVLAWIVPGYWRENMLLFVSTVAMAVAITVAMHASTAGLRAERRRRTVAGS